MPLPGIPIVESAITWYSDCCISHYMALRLLNQQSVPHMNVDESLTRSRHTLCTSFSVSTLAMNLKVSWPV